MKVFLPWRSRLYLQTAVVTIFIVFLALALIGFLLHWQVKTAIEEQFDRYLSLNTLSISQKIDPLLVSAVQEFGEKSRSAAIMLQELNALARKNNLRRIILLNPDGQVILDSNQESLPGEMFYDLFLDQAELAELTTDKPISSRLIEVGGEPIKRGYALVHAENIEFIVAIEASSSALQAWGRIRQTFSLIAVVILVMGFVAAVLFSKTLTTPIHRLAERARDIRRGDFSTPIAIKRTDEIGKLAESMESMRKAIQRKIELQKIVLAGVAHELKNPLSGIKLFAEILANKRSDHESQEQAKKILREANQIHKILIDFSEFGRPSKAQITQCNLTEEVKETLDIFQKNIKEKGLSIEIESEINSSYSIRFDSVHLRQVLANLFRNVIFYSPQDGTINITFGQKKDDIFMVIQDQGPGISDEIAGMIFEPFFSTEEGHTGLGLSIVKTLIEENKGRIELLPSEKGARFKLTFERAE